MHIRYLSLGFLDLVVASPYKVGMPEVVRQVLADPILVGMILFAIFVNAGALGLKWERRREAMGDAEARARSESGQPVVRGAGVLGLNGRG